MLLLLLLLLLSHFSHVQLCATPWTAAHQAPLSLGFSRQEHWSGLPLPSPVRESEVAQLCPTLSDPIACSLPGSSTSMGFSRQDYWSGVPLPLDMLWAKSIMSKTTFQKPKILEVAVCKDQVKTICGPETTCWCWDVSTLETDHPQWKWVREESWVW